MKSFNPENLPTNEQPGSSLDDFVLESEQYVPIEFKTHEAEIKYKDLDNTQEQALRNQILKALEEN